MRDRGDDIGEATRQSQLRKEERTKHNHERELERVRAEEAVAAGEAPNKVKKQPKVRASGGIYEEASTGPEIIQFLVRADTFGTVEAVCGTILEISSPEVQPNVLRSAAGPVTEWDVEQASMSSATIINFSQPVAPNIRTMADRLGVDVREYTVIYRITEDVTAILEEKLPEKVETRVVGESSVLEIFKINVRGNVYRNVAGVKVDNGKMAVGGLARLVRMGTTVWEGTFCYFLCWGVD